MMKPGKTNSITHCCKLWGSALAILAMVLGTITTDAMGAL